MQHDFQEDTGSVLTDILLTLYGLSDDDKRRRKAPAAEHPIRDCALVWASVHGPEPLIYTHRPRASRTDWPDILSTGYPNRGCVQERNKLHSEENDTALNQKYDSIVFVCGLWEHFKDS